LTDRRGSGIRSRFSLRRRIVYKTRSSGSALQPHNPKEIDDSDSEAIENAVFGDAPGTRPVADRHRIDGPSLPQDECRKKTVHVIEKR